MPQPLRIVIFLFVAGAILTGIAYLFVRTLKASEDASRLVVKWLVTLLVLGWVVFEASRARGGQVAFVLTLVVLPACVVFIVLWGRSISELMARPFTSMLTGGNEEPELRPLYSIAEAQRKRGKYFEAMYAIKEQLQKFPHDFTGHMMLAELQAENMNDLPGAEVTVRRACAQPGHPPKQVAYAFNQLADWHLKFERDTEAAQESLEEIIDRFPDTDLAQNAAARIAHLAGTQLVADIHARPTLTLKPGVEYLSMVKDQSKLLPKEKDFKVEAEELVEHLEHHPFDSEARERLAVIYADNYGRLDFATEQLEQLIAQPNESARHVARWLNLLADLQIHCTHQTELAKATLERIIERFPNQSPADLAQQRLMSLELEIKRYEETRVVKFVPS